MNETSIRLIRDSFAQVAALASPAAILFYGRLFSIDPSTREIFAQPDMRAQGAQFIAVLDYAVAMLDQPDRLLPIARALARRHAARGLRPEHYGAMGEALDWMLAECLAEEYSPELRLAWKRAYNTLASEMMKEAYRAQAA